MKKNTPILFLRRNDFLDQNSSSYPRFFHDHHVRCPYCNRYVSMEAHDFDQCLEDLHRREKWVSVIILLIIFLSILYFRG